MGVSHILAPPVAFRSVSHLPEVRSTGGCRTRLRKYGMRSISNCKLQHYFF